MSANVIIFDSAYMSEQAKNLDNAHKVINEAVRNLKNATAHNGWKCSETRNIVNNIDTIISKLGKLDNGVESVAQVLKKGSSRFQQLESNAHDQANRLSSDLKNKYGFSASIRGQNNQTKLPVTEVPKKEDNFIVKILKGTVKNVIHSACSTIGSTIGRLVGEVKGQIQGVVADVKEAFIDKMVNIFQASYSLRETLAEPPYDDTAKALAKIAINSVGLIGSVLTFGHDFGVGKVTDKVAKVANHFGKVDTAYGIAESIETGDAKVVVENILDVAADSLVPFGLDKTVFGKITGGIEGTKKGEEIGNTIADKICNFLNL